MIKANDKKSRRDNKEDHPDISHIPNDQPIPSPYPDKGPAEIPVDEPNTPGPSPKDPPIKEPNRNPSIRVLNIPL